MKNTTSLAKKGLPLTSSKRWKLAERLDSDLIKHILLRRGISDPTAFLEPNFTTGLHDPFLMKGMAVAIDRLVRAIEAKEVIGVFADYDTDGTPGAALLLDVLRQLGVATAVYIPRRTEGYGLSLEGLEKLHAANASVVITIDLGITGRAAVLAATQLGLEVIVTDHHVVQPELFPETALAVLNPKQADCLYPFKELCGGGIVWKLISALLKELHDHHPELLLGKNPVAVERWVLDLAAISTICDMVPLVDENRILAQFGLEVLKKRGRPGLKALLTTSGTDLTKVTATTVGFQIGPRINAPTRLSADSYPATDRLGPQASKALALLLTESVSEAEALARELHTYNQDRQMQLTEVLEEAEQRVLREGLHEQKIIFVTGDGWPAGIVGLVASRLMERFGRPTIVLGLDGDEAVGSARSIDGYHLVEALQSAQGYLKKFGGHAKAAGLTIERHSLEAAYDQLLRYADEHLREEDLGPQLTLEAELSEGDLTTAIAEALSRLAPHGVGNPRPTFLISNVILQTVRRVGANQDHAKLSFSFSKEAGTTYQGIAFRMAEQLAGYPIESRLDLAANLAINDWQDNRSLDLHIVDVRPAAAK